MMWLRLILVVVAALCTACATASIYFPQYHRAFGPPTLKTEYTVYYWYADSTVMIGGEPVTTRLYTRNASNTQVRALYLLAFALAVAGAALGGVTSLLLASWTCAGHQSCLGSVCDFMSFLSFICCAAAMAVSVALFLTTSYEMLEGDSAVATPYAKEGFQLKEGFCLIVAASGGFFILSIATCIARCCSRPSSKQS